MNNILEQQLSTLTPLVPFTTKLPLELLDELDRKGEEPTAVLKHAITNLDVMSQDAINCLMDVEPPVNLKEVTFNVTPGLKDKVSELARTNDIYIYRLVEIAIRQYLQPLE